MINRTYANLTAARSFTMNLFGNTAFLCHKLTVYATKERHA